MRAIHWGFGLGLAAMLGLQGCERPPPSLVPAEGEWRATAELPGGELPFGLKVVHAQDGEPPTVHLINGAEKVQVGEVQLAPDGSLSLVFPAFNNRIDAQLSSPSEMSGQLQLVKRGGELQHMPFKAYHGYSPATRFGPAPGSSEVRSVQGRWSVEFTEEDGTRTAAVAEFRQQAQEVTGTFMTPTGDYRYLAGNVLGDTVSLSTFDGAHAFLFRAHLDQQGGLTGDFWSGTKWHEDWVARADPSAQLPDANQLTFLKDGYERFQFQFPNQLGQPVSLEEPRFAGKVVLVTLMGTWCPNCHDEAAFLSEFYRAHQGRGLEIVALMFEHFEDFDTAAGQVQRFREKFDIGFETLVAGYSDKTSAGETLPMLNRVLAFPTLIMMDRQGEVRRIHTGFTGPGTGEHYERWVAEFTSFVDGLLKDI